MATSKPMQLGMVGLGRMGANIVRRIMKDGHTAVVRLPGPPASAGVSEKPGVLPAFDSVTAGS